MIILLLLVWFSLCFELSLIFHQVPRVPSHDVKLQASSFECSIITDEQLVHFELAADGHGKVSIKGEGCLFFLLRRHEGRLMRQYWINPARAANLRMQLDDVLVLMTFSSSFERDESMKLFNGGSMSSDPVSRIKSIIRLDERDAAIVMRVSEKLLGLRDTIDLATLDDAKCLIGTMFTLLFMFFVYCVLYR